MSLLILLGCCGFESKWTSATNSTCIWLSFLVTGERKKKIGRRNPSSRFKWDKFSSEISFSPFRECSNYLGFSSNNFFSDASTSLSLCYLVNLESFDSSWILSRPPKNNFKVFSNSTNFVLGRIAKHKKEKFCLPRS